MFKVMFATRRLKKQLETIPLPIPFTVEALAAAIGEHTGRRIELVEVDPPRFTDMRTACGLRAHWRDTTYVLYRRRPTLNQVDHTVLHELAHEWLGHGTVAEITRTPIPSTLLTHVTGGQLAPEALLQVASCYTAADDREAELAALLIKDMARRLPIGDDEVSALDATLTHPFAPVLWRSAA